MSCSNSHHNLRHGAFADHSSPQPSVRPSLDRQFELGEVLGSQFPPEQILAFPITPPPTDDDTDLDPRAERTLSTATHVLSTEATALSCLSRLYATDPLCRSEFLKAVEAIVDSQEKGGKIIVIGVGKSGKIGDKLVATMVSLGLMTIFLNPVEALHGDLGIVRKVSVSNFSIYRHSIHEYLFTFPCALFCFCFPFYFIFDAQIYTFF